MTLRPSYLAGVLAIGLALTACSSSGGNPPPIAVTTQGTTLTTAPVTTTPSTPTTTASSSAAGTAPSHDALTAIVAQQGDVPTGYAGQPSSTSADEKANQAKVVACVGSTSVDPTDEIEEVHGDDFVKDPQTVSSDVTSFKSPAAVDALVAVLQDPKAGNCFDSLVRDQVTASGGTVTSSNVTVTPGNNGGPSNVVALLQGSVKITAGGQSGTANVVEAFIRGNQVLATVSIEAINTDPDVDAFKQVGTAVATRAATS